ncbi:MAG: hypothetical protein JW993_06255 [Sedimentisphaerales bacterium]|nr:hypothetical protein [Sedimentisphaerales bacterium]
MKSMHCLLFGTLVSMTFLFAGGVQAQIEDSADESIAGIPVNYTEAKAGDYTLPDPLKLANGEPVRDAETWFEKRRPEIVKLFEANQYGRVPATAPKVTWEVVSTDANALDGVAIMKQLAGHMGSPDGPAIDVTLYTPAKAEKPVPALVSISFNFSRMRMRRGNATSVPPRTVMGQAAAGRAGRGALGASRGPRVMRGGPAELIAHGFAYALITYNSIETDAEGQPNINIARKLALAPGQTKPADDEWGAIAAWAWGISRFVDYLETDPAVDAKRVAITGVSRLGKTVMWAGAADTRIAMVIASCSGEGGAALSRRDYGETVAHLTTPTRYPYQFCANYATWADKVDEMPMDAHMLVALIGPRPVLLQTGNTDKWSDPKGEFLAAVAAGPVYELLGKEGLGTDQLPPAGEPILHTLGFIMHAGGHGTVPPDWDVFLKFMETHLR